MATSRIEELEPPALDDAVADPDTIDDKIQPDGDARNDDENASVLIHPTELGLSPVPVARVADPASVNKDCPDPASSMVKIKSAFAAIGVNRTASKARNVLFVLVIVFP